MNIPKKYSKFLKEKGKLIVAVAIIAILGAVFLPQYLQSDCRNVLIEANSTKIIQNDGVNYLIGMKWTNQNSIAINPTLRFITTFNPQAVSTKLPYKDGSLNLDNSPAYKNPLGDCALGSSTCLSAKFDDSISWNPNISGGNVNYLADGSATSTSNNQPIPPGSAFSYTNNADYNKVITFPTKSGGYSCDMSGLKRY